MRIQAGSAPFCDIMELRVAMMRGTCLREPPAAVNARIAPAATFALVLAACALTLCRTVYWGDAVELAGVALTGGVAHPSGYPAWSIVATALVRVWPGDPAVAANALSALGLAVSAALVARVAQGHGAGGAAAVAGALAFALAPEPWRQGSAAEVYTWHAALCMWMLHAARRARDRGAARDFAVFGLAMGLALAHHLTAALVAAAALVLAMWPRHVRVPRAWVAGAAGVAIGLVPYVWLPLAGRDAGPFVQGDTTTLAGLLAHVSGAQFHYRLAGAGASGFATALVGFGATFVADTFGVGTLLAALGLVASWRDARAVAAAHLAAFAALVVYACAYEIPDRGGYFVPAYALAGVWIASGVQIVARRFARPAWARAWAVAAVVLVGAIGLRGLRVADLREDRSLEDFARVIVATVPADAFVVCEDVEVHHALAWLKARGAAPPSLTPVAEYLLRLPWYARRPELDLDAATRRRVVAESARLDGARLDPREIGRRSQRLVDRTRAALLARHVGRRPVYVYLHHDADWPETRDGFSLRTHGVVYEVMTAPAPARGFDLPLPPRERYDPTAARTRRQRVVAQRFATALNRRGVLLARAGTPEAAVASFRESLAYVPDYAQAWLNLGAVLTQQLARQGEGHAAWRRYLELAPGGPQASEVRRALDAVGTE
jgi:tetratricopeptide (TPR) repeat protein